MIRIGHTWVDMNAVSAICENRSESGYSMFLNSGRIIGLPDVTEEEVIQALMRCDMIDGCEVGTVMGLLTVEELAELKRVFGGGMCWVAQDGNGHTYAYTAKPEKGPFAWRNEAAGIVRLKAGDYDALSFEDAEPLDLAELFKLEDDDVDHGTESERTQD